MSRARHHTLWADQRLAEAYDLVADVVRDHSIAEDKADQLLAGILHDRRTA